MNAGAPASDRDWAEYRRAPDVELEAMHAQFCRHVYHRHSHETYSFGVTESGAQAFRCRGGSHVSAAGMVMAFNPDDPHDGAAATAAGFRYRMIHIGPGLVREALDGAAAPLFVNPVLDDPALAIALRRLNRALLGGYATVLRRDDLVVDAVRALAGRAGSRRPAGSPGPNRSRPAADELAARTRELIADDLRGELGAERIATLLGASRFAVYRAFRMRYGMAPSEYQRQRRVHTARRLLADGRSPAEAAAAAGFADQAHLTRWFGRCMGITPGAYRRACAPAGVRGAP